MKTRHLVAGAAALALTTLVVAAEPPQAAPDARDRGAGRIDVADYPKDQQRYYATYSVKCAKCHPLARSVNSQFSAQEWKKYLKRMLRRPNSGINEEQAQQIYQFLKYHADRQGY